MRDPNGTSKGSGFVAFSTPEEATEAVSQLYFLVIVCVRKGTLIVSNSGILYRCHSWAVKWSKASHSMWLLHSGRKTEGSDYRFASLGITSSCDILTTPTLSVGVSTLNNWTHHIQVLKCFPLHIFIIQALLMSFGNYMVLWRCRYVVLGCEQEHL